MRYTFKANQSETYKIKINVASMNTGGQILLRIDGLVIGSFISVPNTNGWQNWQLVELNNIYIPAGVHQLEARFYNGGFNLSYFEFELLSTDLKKEEIKQARFELKQNYPNPFNSKTIITYSIPEEDYVTLKLFDILGHDLLTIVNEYKKPGTYLVELDSKDLSSVSYFLKLESTRKFDLKKIMILK